MSASVLYGATWIGDTVPTTGILVGQNWVTPDGVGSYAAGTNSYWNGSSWVYAGNVNNLNLGSVERGGDTVTGPILNIPNVLPTNNANATGTFTVNGFPVALQTDLSNLQMYLTELITTQVRQQFLSQYQQSGTASDIAFYSTTGAYTASELATGVAIPLPTFSSDGTTATATQLIGYGWEVLTVIGGSSAVQIVNETSPGSRIITTAGSAHNFEDLNHFIRIWAFAVR